MLPRKGVVISLKKYKKYSRSGNKRETRQIVKEEVHKEVRTRKPRNGSRKRPEKVAPSSGVALMLEKLKVKKMDRRTIKKVSDADMIRYAKQATNLAHLCRLSGYSDRRQVKQRIEELQIDTSHFNLKEALIRGGKKFQFKPHEVFIKNSKCTPKVKRLFAKMRPYVCIGCGNNGVHNGKELVLELDHANGDNTDNRINNLRWLCPNCHSQTPTFRGRNKKNNKILTKTLDEL